MDLGHQSNLGSLISAVLVGLLALASNQYARMDRSAIRSFLERAQSQKLVSQVPFAAEQDKEPNIKRTQAEIEKLEVQLSDIFERWKAQTIKADDPRLDRLWTAIGKLYAELDENPKLCDELPGRARLDVMWTLFWAAEMKPSEFSQGFLKFSERMVEQRDGTASAQAAVLRLYHGHDRHTPDENLLAEKLEEFVRQDPNDMIGVFMYLIIAREMHDNGHREMAERILRRGIQIYSGYPGHVGSSKLINELMDQKMGKRP